MSSGDEQDVQDRKKKKRYHRHTPRQIQELETMFKMCPHPDEKQRMQLSRSLGLEPKQIKFWFQNRRTQRKAQHERQDNCSLRAENDKIRCENIAIREGLKKVICPGCGGPPVSDDSYFDEQKLRMENARLKEELDRVSSITSKYLGRPITQLPPIQPISVSSLDLSVGGFTSPSFGPSLDFDVSLTTSNVPFSFLAPLSDIEKSIMAEVATDAFNELIRLVQTDEPLWIRPINDGREVMNLETYDRNFQKAGRRFMGPELRVEASRDSGVVIMSPVALVDMFMDSAKWIEMFPTIVSKARVIEVLAAGMGGSRSGSLVLMYGEFQILSPMVPTREFLFLRYCQQAEHGLWGIVDVSVDFPRGPNQLGSTTSHYRRLPSGCLIQEMPNGYSKVSWVEHMEVEDKNPTQQFFRDLVHSGIAFGAHRWVATLQRMCERFACLMVTAPNSKGLEGVTLTPEGKRSMMQLSQRMFSNFYSSLSPSSGQQVPSGLKEIGVRVTTHKSMDAGQPNGVVLCASTSIWLPISCQSVFSFFRDERTRAQWDVLSNGNLVQEVTNITTGSHPGNCISLLRALTSDHNTMLILQESCTDTSGSTVVYAPVDLQSVSLMMSGEDTSYIPLLPSGFTILPSGSTASSSSNPTSSSSSSILTVTFQILVSSLPTARLNSESVRTVNGLISNTVQHIKAALNCT